jgi:hypothetical protein
MSEMVAGEPLPEGLIKMLGTWRKRRKALVSILSRSWMKKVKSFVYSAKGKQIDKFDICK